MAANRDEGLRIAHHLVESRLAACVNLVDQVHSVYRWRGAVESAAEVMLIVKTSDAHLAAIESAIREMHSYEVPEFLALPIATGSAAYLGWLLESLA